MQKRLEAFQQELRSKGIAAAILCGSRDIYYFTGTAQQSWLVVPAEAQATLLISRDYARGRSESGLADIREVRSPNAIKDVVVEQGLERHRIGITEDVVSASFLRRMMQFLPEAELVDVSLAVRRARIVKDADEIAKMRRAAEIADWGHLAATECLRDGAIELEAAVEIELAMVRHGHDGYTAARNLVGALRLCGVFSGTSLDAAGAMTSTIHGYGSTPVVAHGPSRKAIAAGEAITADLTGTYQGYLCDMARTYVVGKATAAQRDIVEALKYIIGETMPLFRPGVAASDLYAATVQAAGRTPYAAYLMGPRQRNIKFVGHGLGLELDELPVLTSTDHTALAPGMTIAYEPIIVVPGVGGATLENTLLITEDGPEVLCKRPTDMIEI